MIIINFFAATNHRTNRRAPTPMPRGRGRTTTDSVVAWFFLENISSVFLPPPHIYFPLTIGYLNTFFFCSVIYDKSLIWLIESLLHLFPLICPISIPFSGGGRWPQQGGLVGQGGGRRGVRMILNPRRSNTKAPDGATLPSHRSPASF